MSRSGRFIFTLLCVASLSCAAAPSAPRLEARAWVLMDAASGKLVADHAGTTRLPPASLTKLMTAHLVSQAIRAGRLREADLVSVSSRAARQGGAKLGVAAGDRVAVADLMRGIAVLSGNDASVALAEHLAGSEENFARLMNREARRLGLADTHFVNATGLDAPGHYSSARDMARLARASLGDAHYPLYSQREFIWNGVRQSNRNPLLGRVPGVDGLKTGQTRKAGYCLVASAQRAGTRVIAAVLGARSEAARARGTARLLDYGFQAFAGEALVNQNEAPRTRPIRTGGAR